MKMRYIILGKGEIISELVANDLCSNQMRSTQVTGVILRTAVFANGGTDMF